MDSDDSELAYYIEQEVCSGPEEKKHEVGLLSLRRLEEQARLDYERKSPEKRTEIVATYVKLDEEQLKLDATHESFGRHWLDNELLVRVAASPKDYDAKLVNALFDLLGSRHRQFVNHRNTLHGLQQIYYRDSASQHHLEFVQRELDDTDYGIEILKGQIEALYEKYTPRSSGSRAGSVGEVLGNLKLDSQTEDDPPSRVPEFLRQPLDPDYFDPEEKWRGVQQFGKSMSSGVGLWLRYDRHENIIDRIVRKDTQYTEAKWYDADDWHGDVKDVHHRIPMELWLQRKCATASDKHFVRMRTYHQDHARRIVSLYNEYCPHEDLWQVYVYYKALGIKQREVLMLPEPALWFIFQRLVEQCLIMRQGFVHRSNSNWKQIVHCDIKPPNVFLDFPDGSKFPCYPTPKLADFGLAIATHEKDPNNPRLVGGTPPFRAPEQMTYRKPRGPWARGWPLLHHTNIYAIGTVMYTLMCADDDVSRRRQPKFESLEEKWLLTEAAEEEYSDVLKHLVMGCLEWVPHNRPKAEDLLADIVASMNKLTGSVGENLRQARVGGDTDPEYDLWYPEEMYKLGLTNISNDIETHVEDGDALADVQKPCTRSSNYKKTVPMTRRAGRRMVLSGSSDGSGSIQKSAEPIRRSRRRS